MENIKQKSTEEKIELLRDYMNGKNTDNVLTVNLYSMIVPNKSFSDDYFEDQNILFSNIEEFLDIKITIKEELNNFISKLLGIYIACIKHCSVILTNDDKNIPEQYFKLLCMLDITLLSNLMEKNNPAEDDTHYKESFGLIKRYSEQFCIYSSLIEEQYGNMEK